MATRAMQVSSSDKAGCMSVKRTGFIWADRVRARWRGLKVCVCLGELRESTTGVSACKK